MSIPIESMPGAPLLGLLDYLENLGFQRIELCRRLSIDGAALEVPHARIDVSAMRAAWLCAMELTRDPALGLHLGEADAERPHGLVSLILTYSNTVGEAVNSLCEHLESTNGAKGLVYRASATGGVLIRRSHSSGNLSQAVTERVYAAVATALRRETKGRFRPSAMEFAHAAPGYLAEYSRIFGLSCRFGAERTALFISQEMLVLPMAKRDPRLRALLADEAAARAAQIQRSCLPQLFSLLAESLEAGPVAVPALARKMGLSERTLHRRLAAQKTSYQEILEKVRNDRAHRLLTNTTLSIEQIALRCGYDEAGGFYRAFQRWHGCTPAKYRQSRTA